MQLGLYSFGDTTPDPVSGTRPDSGQRLRDLVDEIELADQLGLDVFGVGEHHRADFAVSAPAVVLAAAAARTKRIRLTSAVTVLSSDDPVRVYQAFATLDLLSGGRAEIMAGRGSFLESFPLFGYSLEHYEELFEERLTLLSNINTSDTVHWAGRHRAPIDGLGVYPRAARPIPVWIAVGGTPRSVARAAHLGLPLALAIIGGDPHRFAPLVESYRGALRRAGRDPAAHPVGIHTHGFVADDSRSAAERFFPPYAEAMGRIGAERGWPPLTREQYEAQRGPRGALAVGAPEEVAGKILRMHELFRHQRHLVQLSVGTLPHDRMMRAIELFGTRVAPLVRAEVARRERPAQEQPGGSPDRAAGPSEGA